MVETIIITALVSVISTLVFGYFIWSGIRAHKLKKQVEDNRNDIQSLNSQYELLENSISNGETELYKHINNIDGELNEKINNSDNYLSERIENLVNKFDDYDKELHRELDKRFDRIYQILENEFQKKTK